MTIDTQTYRTTLGNYPTGVVIVTALGASGRPVGMVVGTFNSVSMEPPLVQFLPMKSSRSFAAIREAQSFCINVLAADQLELCTSFAMPGEDKFAGIPWHPAPSGAPVLDGVVSWLECTYDSVIDAGDHFIVLGEVRDMAVERSALPLLFFQGGYGRFTPASLVAPMAHDTIAAVRLAEAARPIAERLAAQQGAAVTTVAEVGDFGVFVSVANRSGHTGPTVGMRLPLIPPLGSTFLIGRDPGAVNTWIDRIPKVDEETRGRCHDLVERVTARGYSLSVRASATDAEVLEAAHAFACRDVTPAHERKVRAQLIDTMGGYEPPIVDGQTYDLRAIIAPVPLSRCDVRLALRISEIPSGLDAERIRGIVADLLAGAAETGAVMDAVNTD